MKIKQFEDILAWKKAKDLTIQIYLIFKESKDYGFKDQIQRAVMSIMNNIAEGFERNTDKEFRQFLFYAKGSCGEVRSMLIIANELEKISKTEYEKLYSLSVEISRLLYGLIRSLKINTN